MRSHFLRGTRNPIFIGHTEAATTGGTISLSPPGTTAQGNLLLAFVVSSAAISTPSGWTQAVNSNNIAIFYKTAASGEGATTFGDAAANTHGFMTACRRAAYDVVGAVSAATLTPSAGSITLSDGNSIVFAFFAQQSSTGNFGSVTNFTKLDSIYNIGPVGNVYIRQNVRSGATGSVSASSGQIARGVLVGVKPA